MSYLRDRLKEPSTWRGIILVAASFGLLHITPEQQNALLALIFALVGGVGITTKDT